MNNVNLTISSNNPAQGQEAVQPDNPTLSVALETLTADQKREAEVAELKEKYLTYMNDWLGNNPLEKFIEFCQQPKEEESDDEDLEQIAKWCGGIPIRDIQKEVNERVKEKESDS